MKALLVVDMQQGFMKNDEYLALNNRISKLIEIGGYDKVIFTKFINDKTQNSLFEERLGYKNLKSKQEQQISLNIPKNSIIFEKYGYGLKQEDLEYIKSLNIKQIDVCGVQSDACVYAVALQLWDEGVYPNILINYVMGDTNMKDFYVKQFGGVDYKE